MVLFAGIFGFLEAIDLDDVKDYESQLLAFIDSKECDIFLPYLENLPYIDEFDVKDTPINGILNHFTTFRFIPKSSITETKQE